MLWCEIRPTIARAAGPPGSSMPEIRASPEVGRSRPASMRSRVVLPSPFGPKRARHSPGANVKVTPATARRRPNSRVSSATSTTGAPPDGILEDIRLEVATLARATQNAVSFADPAPSAADYPPRPMNDIDVLLEENRKFEPPAAFTREAVVRSPDIYDKASRDPEAFWAEQAQQLEWMKPWTRVLEWRPPHAQWFIGGKLNVAANCVDRHVTGKRADVPALIWEGEPGDCRTVTYRELHRE